MRKLTLTGVENLSLSAGDTVYVGPGAYRETLTTSHAGSSGSPITYIGDEKGTNTDGVGGQVRVTGSNDDKAISRTNALSVQNNFRTFRGFHLDSTSQSIVTLGNITDCTIDLCVLQSSISSWLTTSGASQANLTLTRCVCMGTGGGSGISLAHTATINNANHLIENCLVICGGNTTSGIAVSRVGGCTVRNCAVMGCLGGVRVTTALAVGQLLTVNNSIICYNQIGLSATATTEFSEDFNNVFGCNTARSNVNTGANSQAYPPLFITPLLSIGLMTWIVPLLDPASQLGSIAGTNVPSGDLYSVSRVATSSWGPSQFVSGQRPVDVGQPRGRQGYN